MLAIIIMHQTRKLALTFPPA